MQMTKTKWFLPLVAVALGLVMLAAQWSAAIPVPASSRSGS